MGLSGFGGGGGSSGDSGSDLDEKFPDAAIPADGDTNAGASATVTRLASRLWSYNGSTWDAVRSGLTTVSATLTGMINALPWALYHSSPATRTNGQGAPLETDATGNLRSVEQSAAAAENNTDAVIFGSPRAIASSTGAWTHSANAGASPVGTAGVNVKSSAGRVRRIRATNIGTTAGFYIAIVNKATAAANSDNIVSRAWVPPREATVSTRNDATLDFGDAGLYLSTGISFCASTTAGVVTLLAGADMHYSIDWL